MHYSDAETPVYVLAIPFGPTAIHVIWATVQPLKKTVGYRIHYSGPTNGSEDVDGPDTKNFVLTGLKNNGTYRVAIAAKSKQLPSGRIQANPVLLGQSHS